MELIWNEINAVRLAAMGSEQTELEGTLPPPQGRSVAEILDYSAEVGVDSCRADPAFAGGEARFAVLLRADGERFGLRLEAPDAPPAPTSGKVGDFYYDIVRGVDNRLVETSSERKSLGRETTFQEDVADIATIKRVIGELSQRVSDLLKERSLAGKTVTLKLRYENFQTLTRAISGSAFICEADEIEPLALAALEKVELAGRKVRLLGVTVSNFFREEEVAVPLQLEFNFDLPQGSF